ncbi:MAG: DUF2110 family protein [Candidatus Heimdallarchaeaceae archaeon]
MKKIRTLIKLYNVPGENLKKSIEFILKNEFRELDIQIRKIVFSTENLAEIHIDGEDEEIVANFIRNQYGAEYNISEIIENKSYFGRIRKTDSVNFGLFVDIGAYMGEKKIDALYPLYEVRKQLVENRKIPLKKIIHSFGFIENLPLMFEVTEKQVIGRKLRVKLTKESLEWLLKPFEEENEALIITGATTKMIKDSLKKTNHSQDIEVIERIGFLEHRLICKKNTRAEGIIPEIGYLLKEAKIAVQSPKRLKQLLSTSK